jgi:hypothetical protein
VFLATTAALLATTGLLSLGAATAALLATTGLLSLGRPRRRCWPPWGC